METKKLLEILDKNINQEQLAKDLAVEYVKPYLEELKMKVVSGVVDIVPGTDIDSAIIVKVLDLIIEKGL